VSSTSAAGAFGRRVPTCRLKAVDNIDGVINWSASLFPPINAGRNSEAFVNNVVVYYRVSNKE
jgi:hypothetical protein